MTVQRKRTTKADELKARIKDIENDMIRKRAYEIHQRDHCSDETRNWLKAKEELRIN